MNKMLKMLLTVLLGGFLVSAASAQQSGDFVTRIDGAGSGRTVTITGYKGKERNIKIPSRIGGLPVTAIGDNAFAKGHLNAQELDEQGLISVVLPASIKTIGTRAFAFNTISSLTLPDTVEQIGEGAFLWNRLFAFTFPKALDSIPGKMLANNKFTSVIIPARIKVIGDGAFAYNEIAKLTLSNGVQTIGRGAFSHNKLAELSIPATVTYLSGFDENRITRLRIPGTVKTIGQYAFSNNPLASLTRDTGVETIEDNAFDNCGLAKLTLPPTVRKLSGFSNNKLTEIAIPPSVREISWFAFSDNKLAGALTIPAGVERIGMEAFVRNNLTSLTIPSSVYHLNAGAFESNWLASVIIKPSDGTRTIKEYNEADKKWIDKKIPNGLDYLPEDAFADNRLASISIPPAIVTIRAGALRNNPLTSITLGANVDITIDDYSEYKSPDDSAPKPDNTQRDLARYYSQNGKKAGVYNKSGGRWRR